ncbi:MAG: anhydro-N-acetylmuramic acid kinase, partial [Congregibacter sp.]|nr:anhydro-N-acetylmuramic acid kinase [Congregibacter sp.]
MPSDGLFIGLMSGTSMDGIDAVLVHIADEQTQVRRTHSQTFSPMLRSRVAALATGEADSLDHLATLDRALGLEFGQAANTLLSESGYKPEDIIAIGSHGQTVRHHPHGPLEQRYSLQIGDPSSIAELTGIT